MTDVLFIAGEGRSGSTLFGALLGEHPGFVHVGELRYFWRKGLAENRRCGCGQPFSACAFWRQVVASAFGGPEHVDLPAMLRAERAASQVRQRRRETMFRDPPMEPAAMKAFGEAIARLYAAIGDHSEGGIVVDSSKSPYYLFALTHVSDLRLSVVHLVRDPRAVAFSRARRKEHPETDGALAMRASGVGRSARKWVETNRAVEALCRARRLPYRRLGYEELIAAPVRAVEAIYRLAGRPAPTASRFEPDRLIAIGVQHTVWGNPDRFRRGLVALRLDEEWRTRMPALKKGWVSLRTRRLRKAYGY